MRKSIYYILWGIMSLLAMMSCDVHELPEERSYERIPFLLHLDFDTEFPLYKEIISSRNGQDSKLIPTHDIRYTIKAYRDDWMKNDNRTPDTTVVFTHADLNNLNCTLPLELGEGTYTLKVWADYVDKGSMADKYYDTSDFSEIILADKNNHSGSNDYRDAFRGSVTAIVRNPEYYTGSILGEIDNQATVEMKRPMGKFKFIATNFDIFLEYMVKKQEEEGGVEKVDSKATYEDMLQMVVLEDYKIIFRYNIFMPCSFNMFTDKPADSWTGMSFKSLMQSAGNKEMTMGYDYVFVNGTETTLSISVEIYNKEGERLSVSNPIDVPIVRNKLTVVKGPFFTSTASGGITINPSFDGDDYNIEIY